MTNSLEKKLKTANAFDPPWLKAQLENWDYKEEQKKSDFMEHMYMCSGRQDPNHPMHGLYTNLWQDFCLKEAGVFARNKWFEMMDAARNFEFELALVSQDTKQDPSMS